jgi:hypothetical protein
MSDLWPKDEVAVADEQTTLLAFLHHQRMFLARKAEGLTDEQARQATCPPSDLTILGLIRHAAEVERGWAQRSLAGTDIEPIYAGTAHPEGDEDGDFHPPPEATLADALETFWAEAAAADHVYRAAALDEVERSNRAFYSVRWILIHLIEEYARHCGHADLIRQAIDGQTGE